jgi:hypothetical protein
MSQNLVQFAAGKRGIGHPIDNGRGRDKAAQSRDEFKEVGIELLPCHVLPLAIIGAPKRVNTVRSGACVMSLTISGSVRSIQGAAQGPPGANSSCMSMQR